MNIENARYGEYGIDILCDIDGVSKVVPISLSNSDYAEILRQVEAGTLTIQAAEGGE
jgi:hypothetical protein